MSDSVSAPSSPAAPVTPAASSASSPVSTDGAAPVSKPKSAIQAHADSKAPGAKPEGDDAPPAETAAEKKARKLKLKIFGKEEEYDLDNTPDEDVTRDLQLGKAARKHMQEAADLRKKFMEAVEMGKADPAVALKELFGIEDPDAYWEERLSKKYGDQVKEAQMTPEQKRIAELEAKHAEYEKAQAEAKQTREKAAREAYESKVLQEMQTEFAEALQAAADLPQTQETMMLMAEVAKLRASQGIELTPQQMAHEVRRRLQSSHKSVFGSLKGDKLLGYLGDDVVKEVIRARIEKTKVPVSQIAQPPAEDKPVNNEEEFPGWDPSMGFSRRWMFAKKK